MSREGATVLQRWVEGLLRRVLSFRADGFIPCFVLWYITYISRNVHNGLVDGWTDGVVCHEYEGCKTANSPLPERRL